MKRVADVGTTNTLQHRLWDTMARIWFTPQIPAETSQQTPLLHTLTSTQMHMYPCTLHTIRKTLCKHLFLCYWQPSCSQGPKHLCWPSLNLFLLGCFSRLHQYWFGFFCLCSPAPNMHRSPELVQNDLLPIFFYLSCSKIRVVCFWQAAVGGVWSV